MFVTFVISIVKDSHKSMQDRPTFGVLSNQGLCHLCSVATTTENFSETKIRKKKSKFLVYGKTHYHTIFIYGKMLIIEFSYNFLYVWICMKLYDKKFLIYGNYMIRSFGQPGQCQALAWKNKITTSKFHIQLPIIILFIQFSLKVFTELTICNNLATALIAFYSYQGRI